MKHELSLAEFVELCNKCDYICPLGTGDAAAKGLGNDMVRLTNDPECQNVLEEDRTYFRYLKGRGFDTKYQFLQDQTVIAEVDVYEPFRKEGRKKFLNQKWHTLISFLGYLDFLHFGSTSIEGEDPSGWRIEKIIFDDEQRVTTVVYAGEKGTAYSSYGMNDWIYHAVMGDKA